MAHNNNGTMDIACYVSLDKTDHENILSFIVQDEYHLKKLPVGAYHLKILDTQLLAPLTENLVNYQTVTCGDYVVSHNFNEENNLNTILFNIKPLVLKKNCCIFKIKYMNNKIVENLVKDDYSSDQRRSTEQSYGTETGSENDSENDESCLARPPKRQKLDEV
ncbi:tlp-20 [Cryptophlebia peltastica nucleopolyhedrovirus]|uniref:Tlp-20 n=1 Tax=Cryptophlebia peltastica nucleopolyhedrovirus TaxID=2304025 RepID=A0A346RNT4_9ABAC|nr:tlp-20 [Cryptophlebia peltastica nucleopolyhedrovirus]AXS67731.1 tlp-20 [Cryptophlebia peltastica nucleopolyhedrovirus]